MRKDGDKREGEGEEGVHLEDGGRDGARWGKSSRVKIGTDVKINC